MKIKIIRIEFEEEISQQKIFLSENVVRGKERELSLENKNNRLLSDRTHDNLIKAIRDEFSEEISLGELNESNYSSRGKQFSSFILTLSQGKQILLRESLYVRNVMKIKIIKQDLFPVFYLTFVYIYGKIVLSK